MEIDLALLCDAATVDASGKLNLLGIFDRVTVSGLPARHGRMSLVLRLRATVREAGPHEVEIVLRDPDGKEVVRADGKVEMSGTPGRGADALTEGIHLPQILNFDGLVFERAGHYTFDVKVDGVHHVAVALRVIDRGSAT